MHVKMRGERYLKTNTSSSRMTKSSLRQIKLGAQSAVGLCDRKRISYGFGNSRVFDRLITNYNEDSLRFTLSFLYFLLFGSRDIFKHFSRTRRIYISVVRNIVLRHFLVLSPYHMYCLQLF